MAIVEHPDIRRTLFTMRAYTEAMRAVLYEAVAAYDLSRHADDADEREAARELCELLTPVAKAWATDLGVELASHAVQVHGGMGYVEETGVAQLLRDARIAPIYEGTNGIQAIDLVGRKLPMRGGGVVNDLIARMRDIEKDLDAAGDDLAAIRISLAAGIDDLESATTLDPPARRRTAGGAVRCDALPETVRNRRRWLDAGPGCARRGRVARPRAETPSSATPRSTRPGSTPSSCCPPRRRLLPQVTAGGATVLGGSLAG